MDEGLLKEYKEWFEEHKEAIEKDVFYEIGECVEPGYERGDFLIVQSFSIDILHGKIDESSYEIEEAMKEFFQVKGWGYSDEWTTCSCCGNVFRFSPNSYDWKPSFVRVEGDIFCSKCVSMEVAKDFIIEKEELWENGLYKRLNIETSLITEEHLTAMGYVLCEEDFELTLHPGGKTEEDISNACEDYPTLFVCNSSSQFTSIYQVWKKMPPVKIGDILLSRGEELGVIACTFDVRYEDWHITTVDVNDWYEDFEFRSDRVELLEGENSELKELILSKHSS